MHFFSRKFLALLVSLYLCSSAYATMPEKHFSELHGGDYVSPQALAECGGERCFSISPVPDQIWRLMQGKTYQANPYIRREDLRYLKVLHYDFNGNVRLGELVCNQAIASDLKEIFTELYASHYLIERIILPDYYDADDEKQMRANNTSSFCYRQIANSQHLSLHARGLAVDLNTFYNPYCKIRKDGSLYVQPATASSYCNRGQNFAHKIDHQDLAYKLFKAHGFTWGGDYQSLKDYQHFEKDIK